MYVIKYNNIHDMTSKLGTKYNIKIQIMNYECQPDVNVLYATEFIGFTGIVIITKLFMEPIIK